MACSGLHCAGCAGGASVPPVAFAALYGIAWVAEHLVEVAIVAGTCSAVAVAAVVALLRWADRRDARNAEVWAARARPPLSSAGRPAITPAQLHLHFYDRNDAEQAAIIRKALEGNEQ